MRWVIHAWLTCYFPLMICTFCLLWVWNSSDKLVIYFVLLSAVVYIGRIVTSLLSCFIIDFIACCSSFVYINSRIHSYTYTCSMLLCLFRPPISFLCLMVCCINCINEFETWSRRSNKLDHKFNFKKKLGNTLKETFIAQSWWSLLRTFVPKMSQLS